MPTDDKISALPVGVSPVKRSDLVVVVQDMATTPETRFIEAEPFLQDTNYLHNALINGGFDFAQRQTPGTLTAITQDKYSADRWRISRENADLQYQRADGLGETGLASRYFGTYKKITSTGKFMVYQPIEGSNSVPMRGRRVTFQCKMKASAAKTIRMAVIELQNAGAIDTIPGTFVSAWGASAVDPTLGTNLAIITGAESKSVATTWDIFSVSVTIPSNSKNLVCAVWSNSGFAANDTLSIAEAGLYVGDFERAWNPRSPQQEVALCQRYYWKTFDLDVAPAQNIGTNYSYRYPAAVAGANNHRPNSIFHPVQMFKAPTLTFFNPSAANAQVRDFTASVDGSGTAIGVAMPTFFSINATGNAVTAVGNVMLVSFTAEAEL